VLPYEESSARVTGPVPGAVTRARTVLIVQIGLWVLGVLITIGAGAARASKHPATTVAKPHGATAAVGALAGLIGLVALICVIVAAVNLPKLRRSTWTMATWSEAALVVLAVLGLAVSKGNPYSIISGLISLGLAATAVYFLTRPEAKSAFGPGPGPGRA